MENQTQSQNEPKGVLQIDLKALKEMTKTVFHQKGTSFTIAQAGNKPKEYDKLPAGTFTVEFNPFMGYYLELMEPFPEMKKVYGNSRKTADRILNTFFSRSTNLGVSLQGLKGSGKTLLARLISIHGRERGLPTLVINSEYKDEAFFKFLYTIQQECIVIFDEYEKVYSAEAQESMLTVLDGTFQSKKLFILTSNDKSKLNSHLLNRPGRIHYFMEFKGLSSDFVQDYVTDNLTRPHHEKELLSVCGLFENLNFDSLAALVWEVNKYDERPSEAINILNVRPTTSEAYYNFTLEIPGLDKKFSEEYLYNCRIRMNPTSFMAINCWPLMKADIKTTALELGLDEKTVYELNPGAFNKMKELTSCEEYLSITDRHKKVEFIENSVDLYLKTVLEGNAYHFYIHILDNARNNDGRFKFVPTDLRKVIMETGEFIFVNSKGVKLTAKREEKIEYSTAQIAALL